MMDVPDEYTEQHNMYEPPMLTEMGSFAALTRGDPEGQNFEDFGYYCRVC